MSQRVKEMWIVLINRLVDLFKFVLIMEVSPIFIAFPLPYSSTRLVTFYSFTIYSLIIQIPASILDQKTPLHHTISSQTEWMSDFQLYSIYQFIYLPICHSSHPLTNRSFELRELPFPSTDLFLVAYGSRLGY